MRNNIHSITGTESLIGLTIQLSLCCFLRLRKVSEEWACGNQLKKVSENGRAITDLHRAVNGCQVAAHPLAHLISFSKAPGLCK